jgi:hypothetical protein
MACGSCARASGIGRRGKLPLEWAPTKGPISHTKGWGQNGEKKHLGKNFHFCATPTVTAGFTGFVFDIRDVIKVALVFAKLHGR